jgi:hypothetical protein
LITSYFWKGCPQLWEIVKRFFVKKAKIRQNQVILSELTLLGNTFKNAISETNSQRDKTKEPLELFSIQRKGLLPFG